MSKSLPRCSVFCMAVCVPLVLFVARADGNAYTTSSDRFPTANIPWVTKLRTEWLDTPPTWFMQDFYGNAVPFPPPQSPQLQPSGDWTIDSFFDITFEVNFEGQPPLTATGSGHIVGTGSGTTFRTFETEMLSLDLTSDSPVRFRESQTLASLGGATIESLPSGDFRIDSFFDVFVEISLDGGATWSPSVGAVNLTSTPEPNSLTLFAMGALAFAFLLRRRQSARARE